MMRFAGRLAIQQRVLTSYRALFFDLLARSCDHGLAVFAGLPRPEESISVVNRLETAQYTPARNIHLFSGRYYLCSQPGLTGWLADEDPQALIVEANPRYLSTPAALRWMKQRGRPVLGWGLGAPSRAFSLMQRLGTHQRGAFLRQFDGLLTYSSHGKQDYAALGFPAGRIFVAPNAATSRPAHPLPIRPESFQGRPSVLFVGRLQARKRLDVLLQACSALPNAIQPRLVIVGDGPERQPLENLAKKVYPLAEFAGAKYGSELEPFYLGADLFVLPGTGGLAVQQAMSWGLPIIMGEGDGTNDDLLRPENGWKMENADELADLLRLALGDVSRLRAMGRESYRIVSEEVNLERMVAVFIGAVNSLI